MVLALWQESLPGSSAYLKVATLSRLLAFKRHCPLSSFNPGLPAPRFEMSYCHPISISVKASKVRQSHHPQFFFFFLIHPATMHGEPFLWPWFQGNI